MQRRGDGFKLRQHFNPKLWFGRTASVSATPATCQQFFSGYWNNTAAIDGFHLDTGTGGFLSGSVDIYGML